MGVLRQMSHTGSCLEAGIEIARLRAEVERLTHVYAIEREALMAQRDTAYQKVDEALAQVTMLVQVVETAGSATTAGERSTLPIAHDWEGR